MKKFNRNARKSGPVGVLKRAYQTMPVLPLNYLVFCFTNLGLDWLDTQLVFIILLFQHFWNLIILRLQIILSSLNKCIIYIYSAPIV